MTRYAYRVLNNALDFMSMKTIHNAGVTSGMDIIFHKSNILQGSDELNAIFSIRDLFAKGFPSPVAYRGYSMYPASYSLCLQQDGSDLFECKITFKAQ